MSGLGSARYFALLALLMSALSCSDEQESYHENFEAARRAGLVDRGWLPSIVPPDAAELREVHDLDTNLTWGCFATPNGADEVVSRLRTLQAKRVSGPVAPGAMPIRSWWPASMMSDKLQVLAYREDSHFTIRVGLDTPASGCASSEARRDERAAQQGDEADER